MLSEVHPGRVTVVVVSWEGAHLLPACLDGLLAQRLADPFEICVVDNASTDGTAALLAERYPQVRVLPAERNLGFAGGNNLALRGVCSELVALVNNDAVPEPGWLAALVAALAEQPECAVVTGKVWLAEDRAGRPVLNSAGGVVDRLGRGADRGYLEVDEGQWDVAEEVFYAPATACLMRTDAVRQAGLFDADYFLYCEDVDVCWRLRLDGWVVRYTPTAAVRHKHGATTGATVSSDLHTFHDTGNRLLTLVKDAPALPALAAVLRLPLTTASVAVRAVAGRSGDRRAQLHLARILVRAYLSFLGLLPRALVRRRRIGRRAVVPRGEVDRTRARLAAAGTGRR